MPSKLNQWYSSKHVPIVVWFIEICRTEGRIDAHVKTAIQQHSSNHVLQTSNTRTDGAIYMSIYFVIAVISLNLEPFVFQPFLPQNKFFSTIY